MKSALLALSLTALLGCGISQLSAADAPRPPREGAPKGAGAPARVPGEMFKEMDANGDGVIDKKEFEAHAKKEADERFARMDTNGDGKIDKKEIAAAIEKMKERMGEREAGGKRPGKGAKPAN